MSAPFCDFRVGLETGAQAQYTKSLGLPPTIFSLNATAYEMQGISATTSAFANTYPVHRQLVFSFVGSTFVGIALGLAPML